MLSPRLTFRVCQMPPTAAVKNKAPPKDDQKHFEFFPARQPSIF
jgi:hypothetical protein